MEMKKEKLIDGLNALASGNFASWRKRLSPDERTTNYGLLFEAIETLKKSKSVVHGEWSEISRTIFWERRWMCSECGAKFVTEEGWNYCPNCGARMDGDEKCRE